MRVASKAFCLFLAIILVLSIGCTKDDEFNIPKGSLRRVKLDNSEVGMSCLSGENECTYEFVNDKKEGTVLKLTTDIDSATDPYVHFDLMKYLEETGEKDVYADDFKVIILRVKADKMTGSNFELFFSTGFSKVIEGGNSVITTFDNSVEDWQYIFFDMTNITNWNGIANTLRLDFTSSAVSKGESIYISEIMFAKNLDIACKVMGIDPSTKIDSKLDKETEKYIKKLLSIKDENTEYSKYKPIKAKNEDKSINLWFNHTYTRTPEDSIKPNKKNTYQLRLAKNELESCQLILSSSKGYSNMTLEITDFTHKNGDTLRTELFVGHYFEVREEWVIDPLPPLDGAFDLEAKKSKTFLIKVKSLANSAPGEYKATVTLKDSSGKEVKKANVFAYVWDFELPEETSSKTLMDLSWYNIYAFHKVYEGDDSVLYKNYYDYLLENRICSYTLPYATEYYSDDRILEYLDNPRVVSFLNMGWKRDLNESNIKHSYNFLSQKEDWLKKAYFYPIDEPLNLKMLDEVNSYGELISKNFPGYKLIVPMHLNGALDPDSTIDNFEYVADYVNAWCPKTYYFNTYEDFRRNPFLTFYMTRKLEENLGTFPERMAKHQAEGDEVWWYVTRRPSYPEITLTIETKAVKYRVLFWQQKLYNVDNFLYYLTNDWFAFEDDLGWNSKHEKTAEYDVYGNGVLIYCGAYKDIYGPVGSLRLECVRDGIEDFEYLTILEKYYGKETVDNIISRITTSLGKYIEDEELFTEVMIAVGNLIEQTIKDGVVK